MGYSYSMVTTARDPWITAADQMRARGMRWTPQRRLVIDVLARSSGHVGASDVIERCRQADPLTTPSTVYRTLDALEALGLVRHAHGADGREEYHVLPLDDHGHLYCRQCGKAVELARADAATFFAELDRAKGFQAELSHLTVVGLCEDCRDAEQG
jgi:Fur family transcriptional regulator, ferric uptake regulator